MPSLDQKLVQSQRQQQTQRLMALPQMQQALHLLQLPILELAALAEYHLAQNPVITDTEEKEEAEEEEQEKELPEEETLKLEENDFAILKQLDDDFRDHIGEWGNFTFKSREELEHRQYAEQSLPAHLTLNEHLMNQAREQFSPEEMKIAEILVGSFSADGYLQSPIDEIASFYHFSPSDIEKVLLKIQRFDPSGIGARSLQESLLIQLQNLGKEGSLAWKIIEFQYDDLLHNRIKVIQKKLKCSLKEIEEAIQHQIALLDIHPGTSYSQTINYPIIPDVALTHENEQFQIVVNEEYLPNLRLNRRYMQMAEDPEIASDVKEFIHKRLSSAKWLLRNIYQRNKTIERIVESLAKKQRSFFLNDHGELTPMTMKVLAEELELHESTIARAVANKYIDCPRGLLPLRSFFSNSYKTKSGEDLSAHSIRNALKEMIQKEDKKRPLSDETLSQMLQARGIACARRTVAKYRNQLNLGNAQQRKKFV